MAGQELSSGRRAAHGGDFDAVLRAVRRSQERAELANQRLAAAAARLDIARARVRSARAYLDSLPRPRLGIVR